MNALGTVSTIEGARSIRRLDGAKAELLQFGQQLEEYVTDEPAGLVRETLTAFESHVCQVAFLGQMKAGKSSLINALIGKPGLLPTDVNPSTAVVTKVRFGAEGDERNTARFHFFNASEWERLMRGGRLSAVNVELSAMSAARVNEKLEQLRERASRRLGDGYADMLGRRHEHGSLTPELIGQYVSAGDYDAAADADGAPENYSDITKLAEISLDGQPFYYPAVVVDTPGVNDPFSVRDEITHANVDEADIYVVVLTAQQPLAEADVALLRMLHGLQKRRIIVVINRLDLSDYDYDDADRLVRYVRNALAQELPQRDIPVLACSAMWANMALGPDESALMPLLTPAFWRTAESLRLVTSEETEAFLAYGRKPQTPPGKLLLRCSGIPEIADIIMKTMGATVAEERLLPYTATLAAVAGNTMNSMRCGLRLLQPKEAEARILAGASAEDVFGPLSQRNLARLGDMREQIERTLAACHGECSAFATSELRKFEENMRVAVSYFSRKQRDMLDLQLSDRELFRYFMRETLILRSALSQDFLRSYSNTQASLAARLGDYEQAIRKIVAGVLPELETMLRFGETASAGDAVSTLPLSQVTVFDMQDFWQPIVSQYRARGAQSREDLARLIEREFLHLVSELFVIAEAKLQQELSGNVRRLKVMSLSAIHPIASQLRAAVMLNCVPGGTAKRCWQEFLAGWLEKIGRCESISARIAELHRLHGGS